MTIDPHKILELLTYNSLIVPVTIDCDVGDIFISDPAHDVLYHVEKRHPEIYDIWYPIKAWIDECKRRSEIEKALSNPIPMPAQAPTHSEYLKLMQEAVMKGDIEGIRKYAKLLAP